MKYMGSKRAMLLNGLGTLIDSSLAGRARFVDLFSGSSAVARFVATRHPISVVAADLQQYAVTLGGAVLHRTAAVESTAEWTAWSQSAQNYLARDKELVELAAVLNVSFDENSDQALFSSIVEATRHACSLLAEGSFPLTRAYGGHYYSLLQGLWLDALRATAPEGDAREPAIAALIEAASECSASPGHTAQPFAPTESGLPHLFGAWSRDVLLRVKARFSDLCSLHAKAAGSAVLADAVEHTHHLHEQDLVFIDPPYSEVQYSRFYHVLEGVAVGHVAEVSGVGRYPAIEWRPQSNFSRKAPAREAFDRLMLGVAAAGAEAIVTFPEGSASNGLSGDLVEAISAQYFRVARRAVKSTFSTLGGNGATRGARQGTIELILHLQPK